MIRLWVMMRCALFDGPTTSFHASSLCKGPMSKTFVRLRIFFTFYHGK